MLHIAICLLWFYFSLYLLLRAATYQFDIIALGCLWSLVDHFLLINKHAVIKQDSDSEQQRDFFGSDDLGLKPIRTESTSTENIFQKKSIFFEESVAGSPVSRFGNSPRYSEAGDQFDNFSRFDSPREKLTRFDSINSSKDFGHTRASSSFDDSDPFGSSGPFKVSSDNHSKKDW